jgi:hypothetical protein
MFRTAGPDPLHATTAPRVLLAGLCQKQQAVVAVIDGRMSLLEAAARFRAAQQPPVPADGETLCRSVIGWVELALRDCPERAELVTRRLEQELQGYLDRFGRLPSPE